jgi:hypothetical protein
MVMVGVSLAYIHLLYHDPFSCRDLKIHVGTPISCGPARPRSLVGGKPTQVAASHGPRIEPCGCVTEKGGPWGQTKGVIHSEKAAIKDTY